jgi:rhodanese-related sulfurtransferase
MRQLTHVVSIILVTIFMVSCSNGQNKAGDGSIAKNVNVEEFTTHIGDAQILDVRTPAEWNEGIMEEAVMANIYDKDFEQQLGKLDKDKPVAVYCKVGGRSGQAMTKMQEMGFKEIYNLNGGMDAWKSSGKPTVKP